MLVAEVLSEIRSRGVELVAAGDRLRFRPVSALPGELVEELREHKAEIIETLTGEMIETPSDVLTLARECLPLLAEEDRVDLPSLLQANKPPDRGRDPMTKHNTDKAHFFSAPPGCACDVCVPLPKYARAWTPNIKGVKA